MEIKRIKYKEKSKKVMKNNVEKQELPKNRKA